MDRGLYLGKLIRVAAAMLLILCLQTAAASGAGAAYGEALGRYAVEVEAGPVWQSRNDVQIPNTDEGTRFSLVDVAGKGPWPAARLYVTWNVNPKHGLRLLLAPLSFTETGGLGSAVAFAGETYDPGVPTDATYKFNSWRVTYRYRFYASDRWCWRVGFTAKVRDARIALSQNGVSSEKTDVGFVPLLHIAGDLILAGRWRLSLDLDALAGGPGRAEDLALKVYYDICGRWSISGGYRTVEGGADVEEVYNFAWLHYAVVSARYRF
jgi:hypothetical protein